MQYLIENVFGALPLAPSPYLLAGYMIDDLRRRGCVFISKDPTVQMPKEQYTILILIQNHRKLILEPAKCQAQTKFRNALATYPESEPGSDMSKFKPEAKATTEPISIPNQVEIIYNQFVSLESPLMLFL